MIDDWLESAAQGRLLNEKDFHKLCERVTRRI